MAETKAKLKSVIYKPEDSGKEDFQPKVKSGNLFSDHSYFKTVFISGDELTKLEAADRKKEKEDWEKKVVVDNKHFTVNTRVPNSHQIDKNHSIREDPVKKLGLRLS